MIRPKNEPEDFLLSITKNVKRLVNKLIQNLKKHWTLKCPNHEKHFISTEQLGLKKKGC